MSMSEYSLSDIAAASGESGFGGNYAPSSQHANCCCTTQRGIDSVNYNGAINTAAVQQTAAEQTQKVLDAITGNCMVDMQNQINQPQLSQAMCGAVRYPQHLRL